MQINSMERYVRRNYVEAILLFSSEELQALAMEAWTNNQRFLDLAFLRILNEIDNFQFQINKQFSKILALNLISLPWMTSTLASRKPNLSRIGWHDNNNLPCKQDQGAFKRHLSDSVGISSRPHDMILFTNWLCVR